MACTENVDGHVDIGHKVVSRLESFGEEIVFMDMCHGGRFFGLHDVLEVVERERHLEGCVSRCACGRICVDDCVVAKLIVGVFESGRSNWYGSE